ncbi:cytochrome P450 [Streptomyces sp. Rer75]|uniref:cytochrome P450 n=1 Tax=Streptomyces sp. Rer75 TaxID=2750011 RepID=UPI0015CFAD95|nr:cytochrome P450 [Streptomyces sp. Rer75]QLH19419.1 cytochrome P450 [Streptomyces sp. Rer75]
MPTSRELPALTTEARPVLDPSPLRELRASAPVCRVHTPAGDEAWLVTRHAEVKKLLHDERLGRSHPSPETAPRYVKNSLLDLLVADDPQVAREVHARTRALFTPNFSAKRIRALRPRIEELASDLVEELAAQERPVDLHAYFSSPFSLRILCELIGVPDEDRERCAALLAGMGQIDTGQSVVTGPKALFGLLAGVSARKRAEPGDDVISRMCEAGIPDDHAGSLAAVLLFAGLESVATHIDLGVVLLSAHPEQRGAVLRDPALLTGTVEEVLRSAKRAGATLPRYASEDIEIAGVTIHAGELVLLDFALANFDEQAFSEPELFDVTRSPNPHLTFGHGIWHCVGAPLARVELSTAFTTLFSRLPGLRPAVPLDELRTRGGELVGGLAELPVTW